jgi:HTH-type transcriptional regulator/antitoxin HigA
LSDRYKREDSFWFSFFHEAAHILLHPKRELFVDAGKSDDETMETEANQFAASLLVPPAAADKLPNLRSNPDVMRFAAGIGIAAGIVVGRLHNDGIWPWNRGNELIKSVEIVQTDTK